MKKHKLMIIGVLGLLAWLALGPGLGQAQGPEILPVDANGTPIPNSPVTVSIMSPETGSYMTEYWLPEPNQPVIIEVNGVVSVTSFELVPAGTGFLTTSAYPGECTNYGDPTDLSPDFDPPQLSGPNSLELIPRDCGGKAVILVNGIHTFVIPQDDDKDGMATIYETQYCPSGDCVPDEDNDIGPDADSPAGDGIAAIDEYRGFRVSGKYIRTDPMAKDFFVNFVVDQCQATAGGDDVNLNTFYQDDPERFFANINSLSPGMRIHRINSDEWIDKFVSYSAVDEVEYSSDADAALDRQIAQNALVPGNPAKGVRLIECLDTDRMDPLGLSSKGSPDGLNKNDGNAVIFTRRIWEHYKDLFALGGPRELQYYTFENGRWSLKDTFDSPPSDFLNSGSVKEIMRYAYAFYGAHEAAGHSLDLTSTLEGTKRVAYGYHHADGTGTNIDIRIVQKIDKKTYPNGYNKFYIPGSFGISDKRDMRILSSQ